MQTMLIFFLTFNGRLRASMIRTLTTVQAWSLRQNSDNSVLLMFCTDYYRVVVPVNYM